MLYSPCAVVRYRVHRKLTEMKLFTRTQAFIVHAPSGTAIGTLSETELRDRTTQQVTVCSRVRVPAFK